MTPSLDTAFAIVKVVIALAILSIILPYLGALLLGIHSQRRVIRWYLILLGRFFRAIGRGIRWLIQQIERR